MNTKRCQKEEESKLHSYNECALNPPQRVSRDRRDHSEITYMKDVVACAYVTFKGGEKMQIQVRDTPS